MMRSLTHLLFGLFLCVAGLVSAEDFTNPLKERDGSDPFIVWHDGFYYLTTTTTPTVQLTRATTLNGLKTGETKIVWSDTEATRKCDLWAPEIHEFDGTWYLYYSASACDADSNRPHVLKGGASPWDDTYTYLGQLTETWGIDGSIVSLNHVNYFVYSCREDVQSLCISVLEAPDRLGERKVLSKPSAPWESSGFPVNEGPTAIYKDGRTWLAFSASFCGTDEYSLGLLEFNGGDPLDMASWTKSGPFFTSANGNYGPGHNAYVMRRPQSYLADLCRFFLSPDTTEWWNVFHATPNSNGACDGSRYTCAQILKWKDGRPDFGTPEPLGTVFTGPSGE